VSLEFRVRCLPERLVRSAGLRHTVMLGLDVCAFVFAGVLAFLLRFEFGIPHQHLIHLAYAVPTWVVAKGVAFRVFQLDRGGWRYVSIHDVSRLGLANAAGTILAAGAILCWGPAGFPRSIYAIDFLLCLMATAGNRFVVRLTMEAASFGKHTLGQRTLIYGAGEAGVSLLRETRRNSGLGYSVCGFLDDEAVKRGQRIQGTPVLGEGRDLAKVAVKYGIEQVLVAIPSATGAQMTRILEHCHAVGVACKTVPGLGEVLEERGLAGQIREVAVEDLLGRKPVRLEGNRIRGTVGGKVVLVTGAAGSIGSELCRQIARFRPAGIVGFEIAESPLFEIDREMRQAFPEVPFYPEIGSIQNRARLDEVLRQYSPAVVYHAAAYKHVPMMEAHIFEAIENNVFGTYNVAVAAGEHGVEDFVMISSDKAVRPTNVMGATKRVAELLLLGLQGRGAGVRGQTGLSTSVASLPAGQSSLSSLGALLSAVQGNGDRPEFPNRGNSSQSPFPTKYMAVRFGNVLGSNGSVIPIFKKQIAAGGPVTVTHPEMRRFFMTIPEACQLVLEAAVIGEGGQICVLEMGEPVKIVDLARNLILLSGLKPGEDIKIEFTGMRPGEKLYEELNSMLEDTVPTAHEKVRIFMGNGIPEGNMLTWLDRLHEICETRDAGRLVVALKEIVLDYSPSADLLKRILEPRERHAVAAAAH
jgi:FlaA1/EpsC-like NDP-sugar epimerase